MSSLAVLRAKLLVLLATTTDDPLYTASVLNSALIDAHHSVVDSIHKQNRSYLVKRVVLVPDSTTTWTYTLATNAVATGVLPPGVVTGPVTDFSRYIEIRKTTDDGDLLNECSADQLRDAGNGFFAIEGPDDSPVLELSKDT